MLVLWTIRRVSFLSSFQVSCVCFVNSSSEARHATIMHTEIWRNPNFLGNVGDKQELWVFGFPTPHIHFFKVWLAVYPSTHKSRIVVFSKVVLQLTSRPEYKKTENQALIPLFSFLSKYKSVFYTFYLLGALYHKENNVRRSILLHN